MIKRKPVWAGHFYTAEADMLRQQIMDFIKSAGISWEPSRRLFGVVAPHAGYIYSGAVAGYSYKVMSHYKPELVVVISPSHREYFAFNSVYQGDAYETPLGVLPVHQEAKAEILKYKEITESFMGHADEHALEVHLPFLQVIYSYDFRILPIVMGEQDDRRIKALSEALYHISEKYDFLVVASSDLSHFHSHQIAEKKDLRLSALLENYDLDEVREENFLREVEACGLGPILALMEYARLSGNPGFKTLKYDTSATTSGDYHRVVGYLSAAVYE